MYKHHDKVTSLTNVQTSRYSYITTNTGDQKQHLSDGRGTPNS